MPAAVIGVMPPGFSFPNVAEVWQPLVFADRLADATRGTRTLAVIGRLNDSISIERARLELAAVASQLAREHPETNRGITAVVTPPLERMRRFVRPMLMTLLAAAGFVLIIACANVASLLLARAGSRAREIAIRASLGATRGRIVRQLLIESVLMSAAGGLVGLVLSAYGARFFGVAFDQIEVASPDRSATPYWVNLTMDATVFGFVAAVCLGSSLAFGLAPALHVSRTDVSKTLKDSGRGSTGGPRVRRWTGALVVGELALTMVLLAGAGLQVRSFVMLYRTNLVIDTGDLSTARLALPPEKYATREERYAFIAALDRRLASNPAMRSVTIASDLPFVSLGGSIRQVVVEGSPVARGHAPLRTSYVAVGPRYLATLGLGVIRGRTFGDRDGSAGHEAAIVNQRFATMFFGAESAVGRRVRLASEGDAGAVTPWLTVVGVVPTLPQFGPEVPDPVLYVPLQAVAGPMPFISVIVRGARMKSARAGLALAASALREDVRAIDPSLALYSIQRVDDLVARSRYPVWMIGVLLGSVALMALVLASVGLYALTAHGVAQRTQEIGVRMALGARPSQISWLFLRGALVQLATGLTIGAAGALAVGRLLQTILVRSRGRDPITLLVVGLLLVIVSLTASLLPARRAALLDPMVTLRHE